MHSPFTPPIPVETLLLAYRSGIFPMADRRDDQEVFWVEPRERAIIPLDRIKLSKSLRKVVRQDRFRVTFDADFRAVIEACAQPRPDHPDTWISKRIQSSYRLLHAAGHAHSVECWQADSDGEERLVGGLYGVAFDQVFCGESMFSRADNASKVALVWLIATMRKAGFKLLDCQFMTDHLASLGAVEMPQAEYLKLVKGAASDPEMPLRDAFQSFSKASPGAGDHSSPGKAIAQSLTQTS